MIQILEYFYLILKYFLRKNKMDQNNQQPVYQNNPFNTPQQQNNPFGQQPAYTPPPQPQYNPFGNSPQNQGNFPQVQPQPPQPGTNIQQNQNPFEFKVMFCCKSKTAGPNASPKDFILAYLSVQIIMAIIIIISSFTSIFYAPVGIILQILIIVYCSKAKKALNSPNFDIKDIESAGCYSHVINILLSIGSALFCVFVFPIITVALINGHYSSGGEVVMVALFIFGIFSIFCFLFLCGQACQYSKYKQAMAHLQTRMGHYAQA